MGSARFAAVLALAIAALNLPARAGGSPASRVPALEEIREGWVTRGDVLVVIDDAELKQSHASYLAAIEDSVKRHGGKVEVKLASSKGLRLKEYDEWVYDAVFLLLPNAPDLGGLEEQTLLDLVDSGRSLVVTGGPGMSNGLRLLANKLGVTFPEAKAGVVFDHFNADRAAGSPWEVLAEPTNLKAVISSRARAAGPLLWSGVPSHVPASSELALRAVGAADTAFVMERGDGGKMKKKSLPFVGSEISLVSLVQARNNARVLVTGSATMCSDEFMDRQVLARGGSAEAGTSNALVCEELADWVLGYRGVLRARRFTHALVGGQRQDTYRIKDEVDVELALEEWDGVALEWRSKDVADLQVEFVMLDPHVRKTFKQAASGTYQARVLVPDVIGVFKFVVDYRRSGYSLVHFEEVAPVRPFNHDEYERFLLAAYPYYAGLMSMMAGFLVFGGAFLFTK